MNLQSLVTSLSLVPDVVWSGIVASVITLSGVMLSNASNTRRLMLQLKHDAVQKSKDRLADLRRDVYLNAAEEMVKAGNHLSGLPQMDPAKQNLADGFQGFFQSAAKLQLVADLDTSKYIGDLVTIYGELWLKLLGKVQPIHERKSEIAIANGFLDQEQSEVTRLLAAMANYNESAQSDQAIFAALQRSFDFHQGRVIKLSEDIQRLWEDHNLLHKTFVIEHLEDVKLIGEAQIPVAVALRRELELGWDVADFQRQLIARWKRIEVALQAAMEQMQ